LIRSTFDDAAAYFAEKSIDLLHIDGAFETEHPVYLHTFERSRRVAVGSNIAERIRWLTSCEANDLAIVVVRDFFSARIKIRRAVGKAAAARTNWAFAKTA
jgi:hypothetical protein